MQNKTFVVIPAYNEEKRIVKVLKEVKRYCPNIIVVDDGSEDNTFKRAREEGGVLVLRHKVNLGKGAALTTGCEAALFSDARVIVLMDADGQHKPSDLPILLKGIEEKKYDIVFGLRRLNRKMPFSMLFGNKLFSTAIEYLYNFKLTDTQCGFRAFKSLVYPKIRWQSQGYDVETEIIINALKNHLRCGAFYIDTIYHDKYKGTTMLDGLRIMGKIIGGRFKNKQIL